MNKTAEYDVIVIGYGPCGASAANLLGARGIKTLVLERDEAVYPRQRAIAIDEDALRVWQSVGLVDELVADMDRDIRFHCESRGRRFLSMNMSFGGKQCLPRLAFFHQPFMEQSLRNGVKRFSSHVEIKTRHEMTSVSQDANGVTVFAKVLNDDGTDSGVTTSFRSKFLLGCDGGSSPTRKSVGITLPGYSIEEPWLDVQALALHPRRHEAPMDFTFFCNPERSGVDCAGLDGYHRWEFRLNKGENPEQMDTMDGIRKLLAVRNIDADKVTIVKHWLYTFHIRQADQWRKNRVFLCGDAAHIMPPFAGQGISSAVRDVGNLVWKLAAVLKGNASDAILDTYESERRKNVADLTKLSLMYGDLVMLQSRWLVPIRDHGIRLLSKMPFIGPAIRENRFKPEYRLGSPGLLSKKRSWKSPAGRFVWQPWVIVNTGYRERLDELLGHGWAWISWGTSSFPEHLKGLGVKELIVRDRDASWKKMRENEIVDIDGELQRMFRKHRAKGVLVRPDRFIYGSDRDDLAVTEFKSLRLDVPNAIVPTKKMQVTSSLTAKAA